MSILPMPNDPLSPGYDPNLRPGRKKGDEAKSDESKIKRHHPPKKEKAGNTGVVKLPDETSSTSKSTPKEKLRKKLSSYDQGKLNNAPPAQGKKSFIA